MTPLVVLRHASFMATTTKRKNGKGRPFTKGNTEAKKSVAKRKGVPGYDLEALSVKKIDNHMVVRYITQNSHLTQAQAEKRMKDPKISIFEKRILGSIIGVDEALPFAAIVDRIAGRNPERHVHEVPNKYASMSDEELLAEKERLSIENRKTITFLEEERGMRPEQMNQTPPKEEDVIDAVNEEASEDSPRD